ncbi:MSMEG_0567/Sll0786 family nitrogen starvation N-acetyltransferase [Paraburkholderia guartelaensis]|uniref:MSMEG_0567/Sll0786 family nitrogen starvation N-acetyltransferase n=1 Tax=Paraburkholderia guartelaensis TaxID=2546446 RepID=UPI002AB72FF1|nr:MSMEG_0567/Sll0786 family nitrogen starvation N-acetyltransferase [Paraburkholderia guartelaensis]
MNAIHSVAGDEVVVVRWARYAWEREAAFAIRRAVFCEEQGLFVHDDRDEIDAHAQLLVAVLNPHSESPQVVGTVRIHRDHATEATWCGSRLAVSAPYRRHGRIGATLIRLAVSSARAFGCETFLAHVQAQNAPLFRRLHWHTIEEAMFFGRAHHVMQADLAHYPPCATPFDGFVIDQRRAA